MDHDQGRIGLAGFNPAHIGSEQPAPFCQIVLRHGAIQPQLTDPLTEGVLRGEGHRRNVLTVQSFAHTLIRTFSIGVVMSEATVASMRAEVLEQVARCASGIGRRA